MRVRQLAALAVLCLGSTLSAQQFVFQSGFIPGPVVWSEAVEAFESVLGREMKVSG